MGLFHATTERTEPCTLADVVRTPLKSAFSEVFSDINFERLLPGSEKVKSRLNDLLVLASFGFTSVPHELIHAGVNTLTGGVNKEIVINKLFGGDLVHYLYSGIDAKWLIPLMGGYVMPAEFGSNLSHFAMLAAPYIMTPAGIYAVSEGQKRNSLALCIVGSGAILSHAGGIIGDFFNMGKTLVYNAADIVSTATAGHNYEPNDSLLALPLAVAGFYIGSKLMSFSYRFFKAGVHHLRGEKKVSEAPEVVESVIVYPVPVDKNSPEYRNSIAYAVDRAFDPVDEKN